MESLDTSASDGPAVPDPSGAIPAVPTFTLVCPCWNDMYADFQKTLLELGQKNSQHSHLH